MLFPVVLCGGSGSRLWPASRETHPKPFIRLADGQSILQTTFERVSNLENAKETVFVTNREYYFDTKDHVSEVNIENKPFSIISEPEGRDTTAAIASAALYIQNRYGEDSVILVAPSDQIIQKEQAFYGAVQQAEKLAEEEFIVTFGIEPTTPATAYGYILSNGTQVERFVEKPNAQKAEEFLQSGKYLWNSGMFCAKVSVLLAEMARFCPRILEQVQKCVEQSSCIGDEFFSHLDLDAKMYGSIEKISFDFSVMEKTDVAAVVPCSLNWSDIGDWKAFSELSKCDVEGNAGSDLAIHIDSSNCFVRSKDRLVATIGMKDVAIIDEPDALLVVHKEKAQQVKNIYAELQERGDLRYKDHPTGHRPWGTYTVLQHSKGFKIKRIEVKPGASLSLQMHHHRSEHWIVVSGMAKVENGGVTSFLNVNESTFVPAGHKHRLQNPGVLPLIIIEVQCGDYLEEDDIVRFADEYQRM